MTEAVFDFAAINRRLNRKPEPVAAVAVAEPVHMTAEYLRAQSYQNAVRMHQLQSMADRAPEPTAKFDRVMQVYARQARQDWADYIARNWGPGWKVTPRDPDAGWDDNATRFLPYSDVLRP